MTVSNRVAGASIESALKRAGMLDVQNYALNESDLVNYLNDCVLEIARKYFEFDKESYYDSRTVLGTTTGKFTQPASGTITYSSTTKRLTASASTTWASTDAGKAITFFDNTSGRFFAGIIASLVSADVLEIVPFFHVPDLTSVVNVTIGDWLLSGNTIRLYGENQLMSPENLVVFDATNGTPIDVVDMKEFNLRKTMVDYTDGSEVWAWFKKSSIDIASGTEAPVLGTLSVSGYWIPPKSSAFDSPIYCPDQRLSEVEDLLVLKLLSVKTHQPIPTSTTQVELQSQSVKDKESREDVQAVR